MKFIVIGCIVIIGLLCLFSGCTTTSPIPTSSPQSNMVQTGKTWSDTNIGLNLNEVKRVNSYVSGNSIQPKPGNDFVIITLSLTDINNVTVIDLGASSDKTTLATLITDNGNSYLIYSHTITGVHFIDPNNPFSGKNLIPNSIVDVIFEIPLSENPVKITVPYEYYVGENKSKLTVGEIGIPIKF